MAFQGIFRRKGTYVVVRPVRLSSDTLLEPGTVLEGKNTLRLFQLQNLFKRRRIGIKDSAWANAMLKNTSAFAKPELENIGAAKSIEQVENPADSNTEHKTTVLPWETSNLED